MKSCRTCQQTFSLEFFAKDKHKKDGHANACKKCRKEHTRTYRARNPEIYKALDAEYRRANRSSVNNWHRTYNQDPLNKLRKNLRNRLTMAVKNGQKAGSAVQDLGISINELKSYIEAKFQPGMTWDNWGEWHIDHVKPLIAFDLTDREQVLVACNYTNLQPLWARENLSKGGR